MEGTGTFRRWLGRATVYAVSMALAGTAVGVVAASVGAGVSALPLGVSIPVGGLFGLVALAYALHEFGFLSLPVPGREWQVPVSWTERGFYRSALIFGATVGAGIFTRVPFAGLPVLLGLLAVLGNVPYGAVAGALYGVARALPVYSSFAARDTDDVVRLNQWVQDRKPLWHEANGFVLAVLAVFLISVW